MLSRMQGWRIRSAFSIALVLLLLFAPAARASEAPSFGRKCARLLLGAVVTGVVTSPVSVPLAPALFHAAYSYGTGQKSIGCGIHFDWAEIYEVLDETERKVVDHPRGNEAEIVRLFLRRLEGNTEGGPWFSYFPKPRSAASFLKQGPQDMRFRGVCRHKARVMSAALNHLGIRAYVDRSTDFNVGHEFVVLPDYDMVADPTLNRLENNDSYTEFLRGIHQCRIDLGDSAAIDWDICF